MIPVSFWGAFTRRAFTLRLRTRGLLLLVLVAAVILGWIQNNARVQRDAVAAIQRAGGSVVYDFGVARSPQDSPGTTRGWLGALVSALGVDYFYNVTAVACGERPITDAELAHIGRLGRLRSLTAFRTRATDAGLGRLCGLVKLEVLILGAPDVTDAGLAQLRGLRSLEIFWLEDAQITDAGLSSLIGRRGLRSVTIRSRGTITAEGTRRLRQSLPRIEQFHCRTVPLWFTLDALERTSQPPTAGDGREELKDMQEELKNMQEKELKDKKELKDMQEKN
jgi:hypothetical protein